MATKLRNDAGTIVVSSSGECIIYDDKAPDAASVREGLLATHAYWRAAVLAGKPATMPKPAATAAPKDVVRVPSIEAREPAHGTKTESVKLDRAALYEKFSGREAATTDQRQHAPKINGAKLDRQALYAKFASRA